MSEPRPRCYLIDGSAFIFRAFYGLPPMSRADGTPTNAVFGFTQMLIAMVEEADADILAVIFDARRENFRNEIYPDYKGHRPDTPPELKPQFPLIHEAVSAVGLIPLLMEGFEADDLIATYAAQAKGQGMAVTIVSSDKDMMQLVGDGVAMLDPMKNRRIGPDEVREKFGVGPDRVVDVQALAGDASDNVPGVPGIGIKTAAQLITEYGDLDHLLERAGEIRQPKRRQNLLDHADLARISRSLVRLRDDAPLPRPLSELGRPKLDAARLLPFLREQGFRRLIRRFEAAGEGGTAAAAPESSVSESLESESGASQSPTAGNIRADYELIQDEERLRAWLAEITALGQVAVDTETTGLDAQRAELVGISLATQPGRACYIPLRHVAPSESADGHGGGAGDLLDGADAGAGAGAEPPLQIDAERALTLLRPMLQDPGILKIGQNLKFDMAMFARNGINLTPIEDTMLLSFVAESGLHGHGMDELARLHLDISPISFAEVTAGTTGKGKGKAAANFARVGLRAACDYAAEDADLTLRLWQVLKAEVRAKRMLTLYETIERPLVPVLVAMEAAGIRVDPVILKELSDDFSRRMADLERDIHGDAGVVFNLASPKQLGEILFERLNLPRGRLTEKGDHSTGSDVLEPLADEYPIVARLLEWRGLAKLKNTYTDALTAQINPATGRVHTSYTMTGAQTGRLSSNDPNLQNIPIRTEEGRRIRTAFVAPAGCKLISLDYSQIELRLLAHIAAIESLQSAFHQGQDIHAATASEVFGVPMADMTPEIRRRAKAINFGIIYGISAFGLARQLHVGNREAQDIIARYFARFPGIRSYMDRTVAACRAQGYVETLYGRRIHLPTITDKNPRRRGYAERQAINAPIQGSAADIIKRAMIRMPGALERAGLSGAAVMLLQVHDELIFEAPADRVEETVATARTVMQEAAGPALSLTIPLVVDAGVADNWAEAH